MAIPLSPRGLTKTEPKPMNFIQSEARDTHSGTWERWQKVTYSSLTPKKSPPQEGEKSNMEQLWYKVNSCGESDLQGTFSTPSRIVASEDGQTPLPIYDASEQDVVMDTFMAMLRSVTKDGGKKRAKGEKPEWWRDESHEAAIWSHVNKWKHGEKTDKDSGAHPLVHLAWRALAIAYQETNGKVDPANG